MRIKYFYFILVVLTISGGFKFLKTPLYNVSGRAVMIKGVKNSMYKDTSMIIPIRSSKVLAVKGKILASPRKQSILINEIKSPKIFSLTNDKGIFKFKLAKGEYTFFILIEDQAYLNSFDGKGYFSSTRIESNMNDLVLTDKRDVLY